MAAPELIVQVFENYRYPEKKRFAGERITNAAGIETEPGYRWTGLALHHEELAAVDVNGITVTPEGVTISVSAAPCPDCARRDETIAKLQAEILDATEATVIVRLQENFDLSLVQLVRKLYATTEEFVDKWRAQTTTIATLREALECLVKATKAADNPRAMGVSVTDEAFVKAEAALAATEEGK